MLTSTTSPLSIRRERTHVAGQRLGAPGPQNLASPRMSLTIPALLLDSTIGAPAPPNRVRDLTSVPDFTPGTLSVRRRFQNNTGGTRHPVALPYRRYQ